MGINKKKIFNYIFIITFIPYIYLFTIALYYAIFGYDVYTWILPTYVKTIYGLDALFETLFIYGFKFSIIPIFPLCLIYQIIYLTINKKSRYFK